MKKALTLLMLLVLAVAPLRAEIGTFDRVPAATLLLPHFQVDLGQPGVVSTTFTVGNSGNTEVVAHVTLWTDRGVPTRTFDVRLAAYDLVEVDLGALFWNGTLPQTNAGSFGSCAATLPPAPLDAASLTALRNAHLGLASAIFDADDAPASPTLDECGGKPYGDNRARGFITIDVTGACTTLTPKSPGYFVSGGTGVARNDNVLWGDYATYHSAAGFAHADALVPLEASASDPLTDGDSTTDYTFYRRITGSAADNREGLPQSWTARYATSGTFTHTRAIIWRDPGPQAAYACSSEPAGIPANQVVVFDDQEQAAQSCRTTSLLASQSIHIPENATIDVPFERGHIFYSLAAQSVSPALHEGDLGERRQAYVTHVLGTDDTAAQFAGTPQGDISEPNAFSIYTSCSQCENTIDDDGDGLIDALDPDCRGKTFGTETSECSDGIDNDGDGLVDHPADPHCWGPIDLYEADLGGVDGPNRRCDDGIDNDLDGFVDFPDDPQCGHPLSDRETTAQCGNGYDDDFDGFIDYPDDPECTSQQDTSESPIACSDGIDNDADGKIDFPADPGCTSETDGSEVDPPCTDGIDNDGDGKIDYPNDPGCQSPSSIENPSCDDGVDNDLDGKIDFPADPGCSSPWDTQEFDPPQCSDGFDNDGNGKIDYPNDQGCSSPADNAERPDCSDGEDNDNDGLADYPSDPGCASAIDSSEFFGTTKRGCADGIDNDGDGLRDYPADPGCSSAWDDVEGTAAAHVAAANIPTLSTWGMILAAALLALVAAFVLRGSSLGS